MSGFGMFMTFAMLAVFAQNALFAGAAGVSDMLEVCSQPRGRLITSAFISLFSFLGTLISVPFVLLFSYEMKYVLLHGLVISLGVLLSYFACARIVVRLGEIKEKIGPYLAPSAINGAVLILPLAANFSGNTSIAAMLGLALGSGVGYFVASLLVSEGLRAASSPQIPKPLRGIPSALIYIGLVSLAFCAIGGGFSFI